MVEIGDKLSGRYVITKNLGQGGMAKVFLAKDLILEREVAVKVLKYDFQSDEEAIKRFQREAVAASQLLHNNIVEIYDVGEQNRRQYIVMEYVDGLDLKEFIRKNAPLPLELVVDIMSQILSGIEVAHKNGIIHRDIKPQNILITDKHEVRITDFGIAVVLDDTSITQTNTLLGSVHYLSPEQARGSNATYKSDIYALGVVLYELITGTVPFDGESAVSIALKHFQEDFPRIKDKIDYVPQSLENVVLKATAKNPADRYDTVGEMLADLRTSLSAHRINDPVFVPSDKSQETKVVKTIKPIEIEKKEEKAEEIKEEPIYPGVDDVASIEPPKKSRPWFRWLLGFVFLIALVGVGGFFVYRNLNFVQVPSLKEMTLEEATKKLEDSNLALGEVTRAWDEKLAVGQVIKTEPQTGTRVEKHSKVDLIVSNGKEQVEIGDYVGEKYDAIRSRLRELGFIIERRNIASDESQAGLILDQSVKAGSKVVPSETTIVFYVGNAEEEAKMQDFYNLSLDMVERFCEGYGLYLDVTYEYSDYITEGLVISQSPISGTPLVQGDSIEVVVSMGQKEVTELTAVEHITVEYLPKYSQHDVEKKVPLPNVIKVFIGDSNNNINDVYQTFEITETQQFKLTLYLSDQSVGQYRVMRDGEIVAESNSVYPNQ